MTKAEATNNIIVAVSSVLIVLIVFGSFVRGCEETQKTNREKVRLQIEQVKAGYSIEQSQTTTIGAQGGQ